MDLVLKGYLSTPVSVPRICRIFLKFTYVDVCTCVWGSPLTSGERGIQKTLIPFVLAQSGWMLYYNNK